MFRVHEQYLWLSMVFQAVVMVICSGFDRLSASSLCGGGFGGARVCTLGVCHVLDVLHVSTIFLIRGWSIPVSFRVANSLTMDSQSVGIFLTLHKCSL